MERKNSPYFGLILCLLVVGCGAVLFVGCIQQTGPTIEDPFPGTWQYWGKIGDNNATILFTFLENRTGRYDLAVMDRDPPFIQSMEFSWESEGERLFIGTSTEQQHLDIRYYPDRDRVIVISDAESGIFVGEDFVPGPFAWEFSRVEG